MYILLVGMSFLQKTRRKSIGIVIPNFLRVENMFCLLKWEGTGPSWVLVRAVEGFGGRT